METVEWRALVNRVGWPPGPWDDEPDKKQWTDPATGGPCLVVRNRWGALCGFVGTRLGHPWWGREFREVRADVHGGLRYSGPMSRWAATDVLRVAMHPDNGERVVDLRNVGELDDLWWFGFDCHHYTDIVPAMRLVFPGDVYRTFQFVTGEVTRLAAEIHRQLR